MANKTDNYLIIAASEQDANLYYATKFLAPDPFVFFQIRGKKYLLMNDLEVDRARQQADNCKVLSTSDLAVQYKRKYKKAPTYIGLLVEFAKKHRAKQFTVPSTFPVHFADELRKQKIKLQVKGDPFWEQRTIKSKQEVKAIETAIGKVEIAVDLAVKTLRKSVSKRGKLYFQGSLLTSERLRGIINLKLMELNCVGSHAIVACREHSVDPHDEGTGPLYANESLIMDIFPRDMTSRYHADFTRTVVKGKASKKLKAIYNAVKDGQDIAFNKIKHGVDASTIHAEIMDLFEERGFQTGKINGRMQGFFHGTGHGLGIDIHEQPGIGMRHDILQAGHVVTVEPGLYYEGIGGVRLEDVVVVTKTGCRNLTKYPKFLEIR